jgi:hypothetical protein
MHKAAATGYGNPKENISKKTRHLDGKDKPAKIFFYPAGVNIRLKQFEIKNSNKVCFYF